MYKVSYRIPAAVRIRSNARASEKLFLCSVGGETEIREVDARMAPVAAVVRRKDGRSKYRTVDGRLHAVLGQYDQLAAGAGQRSLFSRSGAERSLLRVAWAEICAVPKSGLRMDIGHAFSPPAPEWMDGGRRPLDIWNPMSRHDYQEARLPKLEETSLAWYSEHDVERWRRLADSALSRTVVCDGRVWTEVAEPCFAVQTRGTLGCLVMQADAAIYDGRDLPHRLEWGYKTPAYLGNLHEAMFSLRDEAAALEMASSHIGELPGRHSARTFLDVTRVEIADEAAFGFDFETAEFTRLADRASYYGHLATRVPSNLSKMRKGVPEEFVEALVALDAARACEVAEGLEDPLRRIVDLAGRLSHLPGIGTFANARTRRALERGLDRWADRAVDLAASDAPLFG